VAEGCGGAGLQAEIARRADILARGTFRPRPSSPQL